MSYLLIPSFQQLWLQWGKPAWVLGATRNMKLHSSLIYITIEQIKTDITWLFNALSQVLGTDRGTDIIMSHRATQDGIAAYHMMVVRYCFGGDIETFKKKQNDIFNTNFHRNYTGGALTFLDEWEQAAVQLAAASSSETLTDQQKRSNFSM